MRGPRPRTRRGAAKSQIERMDNNSVKKVHGFTNKYINKILKIPFGTHGIEFLRSKYYKNDRGLMYVPHRKIDESRFARVFGVDPRDKMHISIYYNKPEEAHVTFNYDGLKITPDNSERFLKKFTKAWVHQLKIKSKDVTVVHKCGIKLKYKTYNSQIRKLTRKTMNELLNERVKNYNLENLLKDGTYAEQVKYNKRSLNLLKKLNANPSIRLTKNQEQLLSDDHKNISDIRTKIKLCRSLAKIKLDIDANKRLKLIESINKRIKTKIR
tara:strand:- start:1167 stop:1973 length:807 start_codon:yes stop_codon:yes gene_type:complete